MVSLNDLYEEVRNELFTLKKKRTSFLTTRHWGYRSCYGFKADEMLIYMWCLGYTLVPTKDKGLSPRFLLSHQIASLAQHSKQGLLSRG